MARAHIIMALICVLVLSATTGCQDEGSEKKEEGNGWPVEDGGGDGGSGNGTVPDGGEGEEPAPDVRVDLWVLSAVTYELETSTSQEVNMDRETSFMLMVNNTGTDGGNYTLETIGPADWETSFDRAELSITGGMNDIVILTVTPPANAGVTDSAAFTIRASTVENSAAVDTVSIGIPVSDMGDVLSKEGEQVRVHYVGVWRDTDDGSNSSLWTVGGVGPYEAEAGGPDTIEGFSKALVGMAEGETKCLRIPADEAYGNVQGDGKPDGDMCYQITMVEILD